MRRILAHLFAPGLSNNHRPRLLQPIGFAVLVSLILIFHSSIEIIKAISPTGLVLGYASNITVSQVFELTNQERLKADLPPLKLNKYLTQAAQEKAQHMFTQDYWDHISPDGTTPWTFIKQNNYRYSVAGENLARDFDTSPPMIEAWMASPTHKANIVHNRYQDTGIAVVDGQLKGVNTTLVVQLFGAPAASTTPLSDNQSLPVPQISQTAQSTASLDQSSPSVPQVASLRDQTESSPVIVISPLNLKRSLALSVIILLAAVILIDEYVTNKNKTIRFVGRNLAHLSFLAVVVILIISLSQPGLVQ